ncbi:MAG: hypothetical protein HZB99_04395 [Candidatus Harrisonbacteria bacterium]|nr:hypothetical protein [Candidatus Harrisonbacteria bacterium]
MDKMMELEQKYRAVIDLALAASDAYSALAKAKRENKPVAELGALSEANDTAADKLRTAVSVWTPDQARECSSHMQKVGFILAMSGEEGKRQWDKEFSDRYSRGLIALKHAFILKTEEECQDDRMKIVNSRIRTTVKFIPAAAAVHYKPEHGLNARAVKDVLERLDKEVRFRGDKKNSPAVQLSTGSFRKLYRELKDATPRDWLEERASGPKPVTLGQMLPAGAADQLKESVASATPAVTPAPAVPAAVPASQTGTGSKKKGGNRR